MKKRVISLMLTLAMALSLVMTVTAFADEYENLMPDGDFSADSGKWGLYMESGGNAVTAIQDGVLNVEITSPGRKSHAVQVYCDGFEMIQGAKYTFSFDIASEIDRTFEWRIQLNGGDYHAYVGEEEAVLTAGDNSFSYEFVMEEESDPAPRFAFNLGDNYERQGLEGHNIVIDNVVLNLVDASGAVVEEEEDSDSGIRVNQVGYLSAEPKMASVKGAEEGTAFEVVNAETGETVFAGETSGILTGGSSEDTTTIADFTEVSESGQYLIRTAEGQESPAFAIGDDVYDALLADTVKMFYLQRCGMELTDELAGDFAHAACHTMDAAVYGEDGIIEVTGGWHDAGDYGRYTVAAAKAVADLILAWEANPELFGDESGIPESGNGVPDILDEARYEIEWMMKLQKEDGGVYHKVTGLNFDPVIMPQDSEEALYAFAVSPCATADFAAVMFLTAEVYEEFDPDFAAQCLDAAYKSLEYYETIADEDGFTNPSDCLTGEYPDPDSRDEYLWAICEGNKATMNPEFADKIEAFDFASLPDTALGWQNVAEYGMYALLTGGQNLAVSVYDACMDALMAKADALTAVIDAECYGSSIAEDYPWGSNMTIANNGMLLSMAADLSGNETYKAAAAAQLNYLLGTNTLGYCYVTGYGTLSPEHTHHRPSQTLGVSMKGMLAGGPNSALEDPYAQSVLKNSPKAACYADNDQSYSCNEITIYWNSPLVYLVSAVSGK